mmetsp:Transcript_27829/g.60339  ORF Transcript_27829/g.60339 Transcript_27829/m.60339 type:complete len:94 (-) Transcript_27829:567-848(-)
MAKPCEGLSQFNPSAISKRIRNRLISLLHKDPGNAGTCYRSCMHLEKINKLGSEPLTPLLKAISKVKDQASLVAVTKSKSSNSFNVRAGREGW